MNDLDAGTSAIERIHDVERVRRALGEAVREAMLDHKRTGDPMVTWRDGHLVWVKAGDLPVVDPLRGE